MKPHARFLTQAPGTASAAAWAPLPRDYREVGPDWVTKGGPFSVMVVTPATKSPEYRSIFALC
jgi:hypothetical protein